MSSSSKPPRAWTDEADAKTADATPAFLKQSHQTPSWAVSDAVREKELEQRHEEDREAEDDHDTAAVASALRRKRFRSEDLDTLLSRTEPLLSTKHDRQHMAPPTVLSTIALPRDNARTICWHRNGQLCVVGGNHHLYTYHASGKFVEQLSKIDVKKRIEQTALSASGEDVFVTAHEAYLPLMVSLSTQTVTPLQFLDARDTSVYRNGRRDNSKKDMYVTKIVSRAGDASAGMVAVASGSTVRLGAVASGSIAGTVAVDDAVSDVAFHGANELVVASGCTLSIYDVRKTARFLYEVRDAGALQISRFALGHGSIAIGSTSGVVSVYSREGLNTSGKGAPKPVKVLDNLTTGISDMTFGTDRNGEGVLAFSSRGQKAAFRLAQLPEYRVIPSFPAISTRHEFPQSLVAAPTVPILSVGERGRVVNYAL